MKFDVSIDFLISLILGIRYTLDNLYYNIHTDHQNVRNQELEIATT